MGVQSGRIGYIFVMNKMFNPSKPRCYDQKYFIAFYAWHIDGAN